MTYKDQASRNGKRKAQTRRLVKRFEKAAKELAFKGAQDPADHEAIEAEYKHSRAMLIAHANGV